MYRKILLFLFPALFIFIFSSNYVNDNTKKQKLLVTKTVELLNLAHFSPQDINDDFSERVYTLYLKSLDYNKYFFTQKQIQVLETYKHAIDDEIKDEDLNFFLTSYELINQQQKFIQSIYASLLEKPFNYTRNETFFTKPEERKFVENNDSLKNFWRKFLKYQVITEIHSLEKKQEKAQELSDTVATKTFEEIEEEARENILKRYDNRFERIEKITEEDRFSTYLNSITSSYDPHTNYFAPKNKEDFDIRISGKLEGIGATLSQKDGYIKVVNIVPGSPSWKQGDLQPDDLILKVAQENEIPVDISDMRLDEAVKLIRGPKGTKVTLTVKKVDGSIEDITITRDVVELEDQYVRSAIISSENNTKSRIGYIYLPQFYVDMHNKKGRNSADDMEQEIEKLKEKNVDGIIIDLRDNGGGSLPGVVDIAGLFVEKGPVVQVMVGDKTQILRDTDSRVQYDGDLVIMVNSFSASASEILAAAMQDYERAVIVGSQSTYGKGTVQRFVDIDRFVDNKHKAFKPLGNIKLTIQKFYRINGGSTQLRGVTPDIVLPDIYQHIDIGENDLDYPLAWTEIDNLKYSKWSDNPNIKKLQKKSSKRVANDSTFMLINEASEWLAEKKNTQTIALHIDTYKSRKERESTLSEKYSNADEQLTNLEIDTTFNIVKTKDASLDSVKIAKRKRWHSELQKDVTLFETYRVMLDLIKQ
ncbi:MAG: carboxy terminal-processing peptidase [Bacteroidales bacterium]